MEPTNSRRTESQDQLHPVDAALTSGRSTRAGDSADKPSILNADNEDLQPFVYSNGELTGQIDEVNGLGATELPFTPTRHELLLIVRYWARIIADLDFRDFVIDSYDDGWPQCFARRRLSRAADLLGTDVVERTCEEVEDYYRRSAQMTQRDWDIYKHGTQAEKSTLFPRATEDERNRQEATMEEWRAQHRAARDQERRQQKERTTGVATEQSLTIIETESSGASAPPGEKPA